MAIEDKNSSVSEQPSSDVTVSNTVALIGLVLVGVAVTLCILLFVLVGQLPDSIAEVKELKSTGPAQLQLLILVCSTAVLTAVAFTLCFIGLFLPNRPRMMALVGTGLSAVLLAIFGAVLVGTLMNPPTSAVPAAMDSK